MKKFFVFFALCATLLTGHTQDTPASWKSTLPRHDVQFSIGDPIITSLGIALAKTTACPYDPQENPHIWFEPYTYERMTISTPALSFSYKYRLAKWFWIGGTASYTGYYTPIYDQLKERKAGHNNHHFILIMPSVRFSWLNKEIVTMYSGLSLGIGCYVNDQQMEQGWGDLSGKKTDASIIGAFQATLVGIQVGRKWYGHTEVGVGMQGFISAGFGYKFSKTK